MPGATTQHAIDGFLKLDVQQRTIRVAENLLGALLKSYKCAEWSGLGAETAESQPLNHAIFEETDDETGTIVLVDVPDESKLDGVKAAQLQQGRKFAFYSPAYVSGAQSKVAVFR
jgi:hypothetical protein